MKSRPRANFPTGYTNADVIAAIGLTLLAVVVIAVTASPQDAFGEQQDMQRQDDVRNYTEALIELRYSEPGVFDQLDDQLSPFRAMIGTGEDCSGSYGLHCADSVLADDCVNIEPYLVPNLLDTLLVDPGSLYSAERTGYYISLENGQMEIGSCDPHGIGSISIKSNLNQ